MKIKFDDLKTRLTKDLMPVYVVCGNEPLLRGEACDQIRRQALKAGYDERKVFHVESGFDWAALAMEADNLSLFSQRKILELRLHTTKIGDQGSKALIRYAERVPEDTLLLVDSDKIDAKIQKSKWFTCLDKIAGIIQVWPVEQQRMPAWIAQRMQARGLKPNADAVSLIAYRTEGNILAAAQEIEKLYLTYGSDDIDSKEITATIFESARFDVFQLVDMVLLGNSDQVARILNELRAEGVESILVLWALAREIRSLTTLSWIMSVKRMSVNQAISHAKIWAKRRAVVTACLNRHDYNYFVQLLQFASQIDKIIKGLKPGNVWDELLQLCLIMADRRFFSVSV